MQRVKNKMRRWRVCRTARRLRLGALILVSLATTDVRSAHAWGSDGHKIICAIAMHFLDSGQRQEVQRLVSLYRPGDAAPYRYFTSACAFADLARERSRDLREAQKRRSENAASLKLWARFARFERWHFLNLSRDAQQAALADCHDDCVLKGIDEHRAQFADKSLRDWQRAEALILLAHWVGDIHQPLHVSYGDDLGGSQIKVQGEYYRGADLHGVWDTGIIRKARGRSDWRAFSDELIKDIQESDRRSWERSTPLDWANESYAITIKPETEYCKRAAGACRSKGKTRSLGNAYQARSERLVTGRLQQAGVRLAKLIGEALD